LHAAFGYEDDVTFYTRYGDLFAYGCVVIVLAGMFGSLRPGERKTP
jgi:apolipoprotein N-acyltransferase